MYDQEAETTGERWFGVQEAASFLGLHRATLSAAIKRGLIIADYQTPQGRARFRLETVEAFRESLRRQGATSQEHIYAPVRIIAKLTGLLTDSSPAGDDPITIVRETLRLLCLPDGNFDMACVGIHVPCDTDQSALKLLAEIEFPERLRASYIRLRPWEDFPADVVLRTGSPEICDDIRLHPFPNATALRVLVQCNIASYAVFPIATGAGEARRTFGVLVVCGRAPHKYSRQEQAFLSGVADALSACMAHGVLPTSPLQNFEMPALTPALTPELALNVVSLLLETAFSQVRRPSTLPAPVLPVAPLCDLLVTQSHALATWADGFPPQSCGNTPSAAQEDVVFRQYRSGLQSLVLRTRAAYGLKREQWQSRQGKVTAVALSVPLSSGKRGAVGAVWPGVRPEITAEEILLSALASACSLVTQ